MMPALRQSLLPSLRLMLTEYAPHNITSSGTISHEKGLEEKLDFKCYLYGVVGLSLPFTTDEALKDMFQVCQSPVLV